MRAALVLVLGGAVAEGAGGGRTLSFDSDSAGRPPSGFAFALTGQGSSGRWVVRARQDAPSPPNVLEQAEADLTSNRFPLCIVEGVEVADVRLSVRLNPVSGDRDQAGGLVWRYRDANNYYLARANALEGNVVAYRVVNGKRTDIDLQGRSGTYGVSAPVPAGRWSTLSVTARGSVFAVSWNGARLFEVEDRTFSGPGRVGLWTKADSVTLFDDLTIEPVDVIGAPGSAAALDPARIEALTGAKGVLDEKDGVFKVSVPRSDLAVTAAGLRLPTAMGLTSWASFTKSGRQAMVMGDMVMTEDQVNPVMSVALDNGLEITALHNHFFWDTPKVMFMHIGGVGAEAQLAEAVGRVFAKIKDTSDGKGEIPRTAVDPSRPSLDPGRIEAVLGVKGQLSGGVFKVTVGRASSMHGHAIGNAMGVNTWAAFVGSDEEAVVDGDVATLESELQPVLKALRASGIHIVAIHQHMAGEQPRIIFLHYWGVGPSQDLARGLRWALDQTRHEGDRLR